jgi:prepilin-type processing-associated H-X9-DG protein
LTELVIAVGVIALLVGILLPTVSRARAAARVVICTSNLRQIDQSVRAWGLKYNNLRLPGSGWTTAVQKVTSADSGSRILTCPDAPPFYSVSTVSLPPGTEPPYMEAEVQVKDNGGHPVTWTQDGPNQWTATKLYQKDATNQKAIVVFTRTTGNNWTATPTYIYPNKYKGVGPPINIFSVFNNLTFLDVQVGQNYAITGPPISPVTTTTDYDASSYGLNVAMTNESRPLPGRVLVMDYNKTTLDVDNDNAATMLSGRHYRKMHNVLFTDGSVQMRSIKELDFALKPTVYAPH